MISVRKSKKDQFGRGAMVPVKVPLEWLDVFRPSSESGRFLVSEKGRSWSTSAAASELARLCGLAGVDYKPPHSLRRGGASLASKKGMPLQSLLALGRWASPASVKPYVLASSLDWG